jgi:hypothetical protein
MPIIGTVRVGMADAPSDPDVGELYYDTDDGVLYVYSGTGWGRVSPVTAEGGTTSTGGGYNVHTFTGSGTFTVSGGSLTCDILLVGGGGKQPKSHHSGGGGGGGVIKFADAVLPSGDYTIVIGGQETSTSIANNGTTQLTFFGGRGVYYNDSPPSNTGVANSGGGATNSYTGTTPTLETIGGVQAVAYAGFDGGDAGGAWRGGGGAGANEDGGDSPGSNQGGDGGDGKQISFAGQNYYWGGGGGGYGRLGSGNPGDGGRGGGAACMSNYNNQVHHGTHGTGGLNTSTNGAGAVNTGGGGAPGNDSNGSGGSGICIIQYL